MKENTNTKIAQSNSNRIPINPNFRIPINPNFRIPINPNFRIPINPNFRIPINPNFRMSGESGHFIASLSKLKNTDSNWKAKGFTKNIKVNN